MAGHFFTTKEYVAIISVGQTALTACYSVQRAHTFTCNTGFLFYMLVTGTHFLLGCYVKPSDQLAPYCLWQKLSVQYEVSAVAIETVLVQRTFLYETY